MTKNIMSIAAAAALLTSGASAFDTNTTGAILNQAGEQASFTVANAATSEIVIVGNKGDALIYPAFNQADDWGTEIVVRNNLNTGVVAKAVLYAAKDSREVLDFNLYLSANDACRFTIKDGKVFSEDDSIAVLEKLADDTYHVFGSPSQPFDSNVANPSIVLPDAGYVVIYGMGESNVTDHGPDAKAQIFEDYRAELHDKRPNWNNGLNMHYGVYVDTGLTKDLVTVAPYMDANTTTTRFGDVNNTALSGTARIYNATGAARDLLINATGIKNYTEGEYNNPEKIMLWSPGEYASMADRSIEVNGLEVRYSTADGFGTVRGDAALYNKSGAFYTYNNNGDTPDVDNKLIITQLYKRTLTQLGNQDNYWAKRDCTETNEETNDWAFVAGGFVWDESENHSTEGGPDGGAIVSPAGSGTLVGYCNEVAEIKQPELRKEDFADKNGYIHYKFGENGLPAIITQMSASKVGDDYRINWVDAVVDSNPELNILD